MFDQGQMTLLKKNAIEISSDAWHERICSKKGNIISGFRTSGIWLPSIPAMKVHWRLYQDGGVSSKDNKAEPWLQFHETVQSKVLQLPPIPNQARKQRKTLNVNNRLLTWEQLNHYDN